MEIFQKKAWKFSRKTRKFSAGNGSNFPASLVKYTRIKASPQSDSLTGKARTKVYWQKDGGGGSELSNNPHL
jgi:hypothetical protein